MEFTYNAYCFDLWRFWQTLIDSQRNMCISHRLVKGLCSFPKGHTLIFFILYFWWQLLLIQYYYQGIPYLILTFIPRETLFSLQVSLRPSVSKFDLDNRNFHFQKYKDRTIRTLTLLNTWIPETYWKSIYEETN